jgi:PPOX class probable F420-dependent enzyme
MVSRQGGVELLQDPVALELLRSKNLARLAYSWTDGSPRVVPIWFHWDGETLVFAGPPGAPKNRAIRRDPRVAITIDHAGPPARVLLVRGRAIVDDVAGIAPEYASAAERYEGAEAGKAWVEQLAQLGPTMTRIRVRPEWVGVLDFETRFPSAIEKAMAGAGGARG